VADRAQLLAEHPELDSALRDLIRARFVLEVNG
jgi:hypothetical protein